MNIFEVLKSLNKYHWYEVPMNGTWVKLNSHEAGKHLTHLRNFYAKQDIKTIFNMADPIEFPIWCPVERKMVIIKLVKIHVSTNFEAYFKKIK